MSEGFDLNEYVVAVLGGLGYQFDGDENPTHYKGVDLNAPPYKIRGVPRLRANPAVYVPLLKMEREALQSRVEALAMFNNGQPWVIELIRDFHSRIVGLSALLEFFEDQP